MFGTRIGNGAAGCVSRSRDSAEEVIVKKLPKRFFQEWFVAITKARHCYLRPKDIDAWTFFFEWAIEIKRAYAEQNGKNLYS